MKIFIAGATGFLGQGFIEAALEAGHQVRTLVRWRSWNKIKEREGVENFQYHSPSAGRFHQGLQGCGAAVNLAGIIREFPGRKTTFQRAHIDFTRILVEAMSEAGVNRYLHMSALGVDSGLNIGYNTSKTEAENIVRESKLDWTIFRPSLIFGPGDRFAVEFAGWMRKGLPIPVIGKGDYRLMPLSRADLCRGMVKLLDDERSLGKTYNIGGPQKLTYIDILRIIEKAAGRRMRLLKSPAGLVIMASRVLGRFPWFPATADMVKQLLKESVTDETDFWEDTGIEPQTLEEALPGYIEAI